MDFHEARYPFRTERKSLVLPRGAYISRKARHRGSKEKPRRFYQPNTSLDITDRSLFFRCTELYFSAFSHFLPRRTVPAFYVCRVLDCRLRATYERGEFFLVCHACTRDTRLDIDGRKWDCIRKYHKGKPERGRSNNIRLCFVCGSSIISFERFLCTIHRVVFSYSSLSSKLFKHPEMI